MANPTGKGGFQDHPELINREGAPKRGQTWPETVKRITDMTRDELIAYVGGRRSRIGKLLAAAPDVPIKDAMVIAAVVAFLMDPDPRMFEKLTDREEGKPTQPVDVTTGGEKVTEIGVRLIDYRTGITPLETGSSGDSSASSQDEDTGDGQALG